MEKIVVGISCGEKVGADDEFLETVLCEQTYTADTVVIKVETETFRFSREDLNVVAEQLRNDTADEGKEYIHGDVTMVVYREDIGYMLDQMDAK